ncbi:endo-1,4-beta-xylanase [Pyricularia oryzae 70-15]|uniref:Endo-1,4-beta-xylanase 5 n=4 Tax=Pyricularia TaxID=48558 RepID=XYN5_PYRGI|nr:endo-1,4-beta-xylanase [Pyricularia oryzae 70-15]G4MLU0.1 RecName: Full=Endo-1,4-beta-xylanase 5; Short=Xylanase 5; AltName: Full=1,4-beta-D-xylan xylanohydrolase 5; Flags: Precursor [Pyricularia oryzae 70-15]Q8J1Y4.1 RecName: Full=Endo-1,4-beta-xylanase 5; Short=Xylanase 5; AltName: Full=1,4-beta-D-xylan xylanohydrolase 5; Flags: Precursor [Pyricularia grisea]ELQ35309.1 endo-1,4-beta-xylanase [Pyricularia oryzae Y34]KAI7911997.1 endo-1 [Pyricularia oryzae]AAN60060.1 endo-beta-1,4-D-xylanas
MTRLATLITLAGLLAVSPGAYAQRNRNDTGGSTGAEGLNSLAVKAGLLYFGTASDTRNFADEPYMSVVNNTNEFGMIVPENSMKWEATEKEPGRFSFANADRVRALTKANGQMLRCHALTWHSQLPNFVKTTAWTRDTLTAAIESHISNEVGHFAGDCYAWDVVNEAVNENGSFRDSPFHRTLGTDFLAISFRAAAAADPNAKLYYNDFNIETPGPKANAAMGIVRLLKEQGVRIDGVGFQGHLTVGSTPSRAQLASQLQRFADLGVEVTYTELDIRHKSLPVSSRAAQDQARDYVSVIGSCLDVTACVGVMVWQPTDKYSWIPETFPGTGDACLFDANMNPKPAYTSVSSLLAAAAATAPASVVPPASVTTSKTPIQAGAGRETVSIAGLTLALSSLAFGMFML